MPAGTHADVRTSGQADLTDSKNGSAFPTGDVRSGNPGGSGQLLLVHPLDSRGHLLDQARARRPATAHTG